jgi:hypothetical protein
MNENKQQLKPTNPASLLKRQTEKREKGEREREGSV